MESHKQALQALVRKPHAKTVHWLAQGFLKWSFRSSGESPDPFYPHSFVDCNDPAQSIERIYRDRGTPIELRHAIQQGTAMIGTLCRVDCAESSMLAVEQRHELLNEFLSLAEGIVCVPAVESMVEIAMQDGARWEERIFEQEIYPALLRSLTSIALNLGNSAFHAHSALAKKKLASALNKVTQSDYFRRQYSPRMLASLIHVAPHKLLNHLTLLGEHVASLHLHDDEQERLSHLSAKRLVDKALGDLESAFPHLDIRFKNSRDRWLISALFRPEGPLRQYRTVTEGQLTVTLREQPDMRRVFKHSDIKYVRDDLTRGQTPAVSTAHGAADAIKEFSESNAAFWSKERTTHIDRFLKEH